MKQNSDTQSTNLEWVLNYIDHFNKDELKESSLKYMKHEHFDALNQADVIAQGDSYSYFIEIAKFQLTKFQLFPNLLVVNFGEQKMFLVLSNCLIKKKILQYKEHQMFGIILANNCGNTFLFFQNYLQQRDRYNQMKEFCQLRNFREKFTIQTLITTGFYHCLNNKKKQPFCVQVYKMNELARNPDYEAVIQNEINILRSLKHNALLEIKGVYADPKFLFVLYEDFQGQTLLQHLIQKFVFHEVQIASIIYQAVQSIKFLNKHQYYHGSINPQNILINTSNSFLSLSLTNVTFFENGNIPDSKWINFRQPLMFQAPEIQKNKKIRPESDVFSLGALMFYLTFYQDLFQNQYENDEELMAAFRKSYVDYSLIEKAEEILKDKSRGIEKGKNQMISNVGQSQIDLMLKMLHPDPDQRITIYETSKHHWFVNVKSKLKGMKCERKRKKPLPSLRTIIELREQSEIDLRNTILLQQGNTQEHQKKLSMLGMHFGGSFKNKNQIDSDEEDEMGEEFDDFLKVDTELRRLTSTFNPSRQKHGQDQKPIRDFKAQGSIVSEYIPNHHLGHQRTYQTFNDL